MHVALWILSSTYTHVHPLSLTLVHFHPFHSLSSTFIHYMYDCSHNLMSNVPLKISQITDIIGMGWVLIMISSALLNAGAKDKKF